tara:strand:+ start:180 stop:320 length:141 start_codon:yes stop_codon:yes gene_type:complete
MGWRALLVNTPIGNGEKLSIYESMGGDILIGLLNAQTCVKSRILLV